MARPIDHLVLAVRDLDSIAATYRRLGFLVGGRNRHPWGTENHIVQLDGTFLELIGLGADFERLGGDDPAAPFANTLSRFIDRRDGLAMVALRSDDAIEDARHFAAAGLGLGDTMHFSRTAEAPDGSRRDVAFTTAFALDPDRPTPEFFVCQHHHPENFWAPAMQRHPNGAKALLGVVMAADEPADRVRFFNELFGSGSARKATSGLVVDAGPHRLELVRPGRFETMFGAAAMAVDGHPSAFRIGVESIEGVQRFLNVIGAPYARQGGRIVVPPSVARGVSIGFEPCP